MLVHILQTLPKARCCTQYKSYAQYAVWNTALFVCLCVSLPTSGESERCSMLTSWPRDMAMALIIWSSSDMVNSFSDTSPKWLIVSLVCMCLCLPVCARVKQINFYLNAWWRLTRMAALSSGGGWVRRYSVACSMVVVFSKASIACSLEKPMSISCTKGHIYVRYTHLYSQYFIMQF